MTNEPSRDAVEKALAAVKRRRGFLATEIHLVDDLTRACDAFLAAPQPQPRVTLRVENIGCCTLDVKDGVVEIPRDAFLSMADTLRASAPQPRAEPVAWFVDWPDEMRLGRFFTTGPVAGARNTPLYTAPPRPQASAEDVAAVDAAMNYLDAPNKRAAWQRIRAKVVGRE